MFDKAVSFCGTTLDYHSVAQTLNVLDYDTYFRMTELLLGGNYTEALVAFDEVLSKGFSGQTFMAGLNRHLRDLLMARQNDTLKLIEMTGTLMERYRAQAQVCEAEFLFGAISILTELDGKIRQASNGRLLVELGLMKIARLGQKKKIEDEEYFELPALEPRVAPAPVVAAAPAVAPAPAPAPAPTPQPVQPATPTPQPTPQPVVETLKVESPKVEQPTPQPAVRKSSIGLSLAAMLAEEEAPKQVEKSEETLQPVIDPNTEQKLRVAATAILAMVRVERPRFYPSFERMELVGNEIRISVPSHELHDEIMRNRTALLLQIARKASVEGALELVVSINEEIRAEKPIKLEDRVRYMAERCPRLGTLRTALDMEVE
jgi:DNA polymerase-3 subunit gamma/tau